MNVRSRMGMIIVALFSILLAVSVSAQNALTLLGVQEPAARLHSLDAVVHNYLPFALGAKAFKAADPATRARLVQGALSWFKSYTQSAAFKADYAKQRESAKPAAPKVQGTVDSELARQKAEREKSLAEMKANLSKMTPDMRRTMEDTIKQMEQMYAKQDADPQMASMMRQSVQMQRQETDKSFQQSLAEHDKKYPADPNSLIARRLREFLDLSKDVDFNAQLQASGGKVRFVNPAYEAKPANWKLCFRAGKPAVDAARAFAVAWLKELPAK